MILSIIIPVYNEEKTIIQIFETKAHHAHGQVLKNHNEIKRTFVINYNFTFDQLYYFFIINNKNIKLPSTLLNIRTILCKLFI